MVDYKQVIVARKDLDLSPGKLAAQASHVAVTASHRADTGVLEDWNETGHAKIVLEASGEKELDALANQAEEQDLPYSLVADQGRTEIPAGTKTAVAIGPAKNSAIDKITGELPLYR